METKRDFAYFLMGTVFGAAVIAVALFTYFQTGSHLRALFVITLSWAFMLGSFWRTLTGGPRLRDRVLAVFKDGEELSGADVITRTGAMSGSVYAVLYRLEDKGLLVSRWEEHADGEPNFPDGKPRRRLYRRT